jgi:hypothetical protein
MAEARLVRIRTKPIRESARPTYQWESGALLNLYSQNKSLGKWHPGKHTCFSSVATLYFEPLAIDVPGPAGISSVQPSVFTLRINYL